MPEKQKLLILSRWFTPGFQAGGLIRAVEGIARHMANHFDIYILTTNKDFGIDSPYQGIETDKWIKKDNYQVLYLSDKYTTRATLKKTIAYLDPSCIYLSGMFDALFSIYPLLLKRKNKIAAKLVLAPSGMLMYSAMAHKTYKKRPFLLLCYLLGLHKLLTFHSTDSLEIASITKYFGTKVRNQELVLFPPKIEKKIAQVEKLKNHLSIVYISRIHPIKKNLSYLLNVLRRVTSSISLTIAGPIEHRLYWSDCQKIIKELPRNINTDYIGEIEHEKVSELLKIHHLFVLPTTGENYGYAIIEALASSRPVLISDQTPWRNLTKYKAGWDLPLSHPESFISAIEQLAAMDQEEFNCWCKGALRYAKVKTDIPQLIKKYKSLLEV